MKNYNKILEAVNRGIQLALDDFDDNDTPIQQNIKSKQAYNRDYTKEYLDLMKEVVDLGLPSGTLWCKYNLDVDPNQLSKAEDWYGGYYAWGELKPNKQKYDWAHYRLGKDYNKLTKYCNISEFGLKGFTDNLTQLLPEDDAAYQNKKLHNFKFHIPTKEQCEELKNYTSNYWVNNYNPNKTIHNQKNDSGIKGLNGRVFEGKNGNQLFIPASCYRYDSYLSRPGSDCDLWTSDIFSSEPNEAYHMDFILNSIGVFNNRRYLGFNIRPVIKL